MRFGILRGDLACILYEHTRHHVEYVFDDSITSLTEDPQGVRVAFERGGPRRFDLVVGADGLHSNVRALAFGPESRFVKEMGLYCAIFTTANHLGLDHTGQLYNTPGKLVGMYSARGNTEAKAAFYFGSPPLSYDRRDTGQQKKLLAEAFAGVGWEAPGCWTRCGTPRTSTSTRSARSTWTAGRPAGSRCSGTPPAAPRRCRAWAPAWP
ncbi:hypothetical protein [Streptosporangium sp. H16]|uniref:hypothetical protein n=1 Tax=Streptosporangium sp. H16 TaxID=3444184 RepID=UPI003F78D860